MNSTAEKSPIKVTSAKMQMEWTYSVVRLPAKDLPSTHAVFLECRDELGNYRGIELSRKLTSESEAKKLCETDRSTRTDWRTATEIGRNA